MAKKISASDIFQEEDIFLGIRQSAEKTILSFQEIDAEVKKLAGNLKKDLSTADFGNTKGINSFVAATQKANDAKNKSIQIDKVLAQATKDVAAADKALVEIEIKKQKLAQEQIKTNNAIAKSENDKAKATQKAAQASKVEMDTYKQLAASTRDLKNQSKELGAQMLASEKAGRTNTAAYAALETQFREVTAAAQAGDAELKSIDKTVGDSFRNVGNYEQATKGLKQQLREMTVALQNMDSSDPRFRQMSIDAGNLKDTIMDTNAVIKSTAGSAVENLGNGIAKAGKVGIDAFAGMTGAMGLFGIESESAMAAMLKLQQLAAMSEALQSLGALGDTMTEIRASFVAAASKLGLFTTAKVVDTTVTTTQTVATEAATVATSGLGKAMKALPIVAIIAGIAALAYGIYSLVTSNTKAEEAIKKREQAEKLANEESKRAREFVAKESVEFVSLIYQLKQTNINSKERVGLIKQINSEYGTTLKNISDETAFQSALNTAVQDYIKFQKDKYKLQKFKTAEEINLKVQDELQTKLKDLQKRTFNERIILQEKYNSLIAAGVSQPLAMEKSGLQKFDDEMNSVISALKEADDRMKYYTKQQFILGEQTKNKYVPAVASSSTAINNNSDAQKELNKSIEDEIALQELRAEQEYARRVSEKEALDAIDLQIEKDAEALKLEEEIIDEQRQEYNLAQKRAKEESDLAAKTEKDLKTKNDLVKGAADFFIAQSNRKIEQIDKEIAAANTQYTTLQTLAANGNINAKESLAEQQKIINEANAQKEKELKKQQRIKLAESVYSTYNAKVAGGSEHPLMDTIKDTMLLQQFIASLPTFHDGTEDTGKNGNGIDGKGGFHAILHPNERVVPKSLNEQIGGLSNEALAKMANEYQNGKIIRSNSQIGSSFDTAILVGKIDELTNAIKMKPETNIGIGEITQSVMEIVKSTKQGNTTTYNRYKVRR
jgi:hypothetical protein